MLVDTLHLFTLRNLPNKYPNLRTSFSHGGMLGLAVMVEEYKVLTVVQIYLKN